MPYWKTMKISSVPEGGEFVWNGQVGFRLHDRDTASHPSRDMRNAILCAVYRSNDGKLTPATFGKDAEVKVRSDEEQFEYPFPGTEGFFPEGLDLG